jgi:hypothetical protein
MTTHALFHLLLSSTTHSLFHLLLSYQCRHLGQRRRFRETIQRTLVLLNLVHNELYDMKCCTTALRPLVLSLPIPYCCINPPPPINLISPTLVSPLQGENKLPFFCFFLKMLRWLGEMQDKMCAHAHSLESREFVPAAAKGAE